MWCQQLNWFLFGLDIESSIIKILISFHTPANPVTPIRVGVIGPPSSSRSPVNAVTRNGMKCWYVLVTLKCY